MLWIWVEMFPLSIDRDRVLVAMRGLKRRELLDLAQRAVRLADQKDLPAIVKGIIRPETVRLPHR